MNQQDRNCEMKSHATAPACKPKWSANELRLLEKLKSPFAIQGFLDSVEYSSDSFYRSPRRVMADRKAHCADGAFFSAMALRRLGFPPLIMELAAVRDDDHLLAPFMIRGKYGAIAKSNFMFLRYREPVYRTLRELVMSYFEGYYNLDGERSLRTYSATLNLARFDHLCWWSDDSAMDRIIPSLESAKHFPVTDRAAIKAFTHVDKRTFDAGLLGAKLEGLHKPQKPARIKKG